MRENNRIALVAGFGNYTYLNSLEYCPISAQEVYELLIDPVIGRCDPQKSLLITDKEPITPTVFEGLVRNTISSLKQGDQFIFFYSGHGLNYLNDFLLLFPNTEEPESTYASTAYEFDSIIKKLKLQNINKAIFIIDACYSSSAFYSLKHAQGYEKDFWKPDSLPPGIMGIAASSVWSEAWQKPELKKTLFSYFFCKGIKEWNDKLSPFINVIDIKNYINNMIRSNFPENQQEVFVSLPSEGSETSWICYNPNYIEINSDQQDSLKESRLSNYLRRMKALHEEMNGREIYYQEVDRWLSELKISITNDIKKQLVNELARTYDTNVFIEKTTNILDEFYLPTSDDKVILLKNLIVDGNVVGCLAKLEEFIDITPNPVAFILLHALLSQTNRDYYKALISYSTLIRCFYLEDYLYPNRFLSIYPVQEDVVRQDFKIDIKAEETIKKIRCFPNGLALYVTTANTKNMEAIVFSWSGTQKLRVNINDGTEVIEVGKVCVLLKDKSTSSCKLFIPLTSKDLGMHEISESQIQYDVMFQNKARPLELLWNEKRHTEPIEEKSSIFEEFKTSYDNLEISQILKVDVYTTQETVQVAYQPGPAYIWGGTFLRKNEQRSVKHKTEGRYISIHPR